jgi:hypothetical protein
MLAQLWHLPLHLPCHPTSPLSSAIRPLLEAAAAALCGPGQQQQQQQQQQASSPRPYCSPASSPWQPSDEPDGARLQLQQGTGAAAAPPGAVFIKRIAPMSVGG